MNIYDLPEHSPRFVELHGEIFMRCECCELPTLFIVADRDEEAEWSETSLGCTICGWENLPADENGQLRDRDSAEDRNDGIALSEAKRHLAQYGWMYDPDKPPAWLGGPISLDERRLRQELRDTYPSSGDLPDLSDRLLVVGALLRELRAHVVAREQLAESTWDLGDEESAT